MEDVNVQHIDSGTLSVITKAEIDQQVATARRFPRSVKHFLSEARDMVTLTERIAEECIYALPRDGKTIEGPSARMAEIIASAWGNCRAGARVVDEGAEFVTAQGVFHDLERNVMITYEQKRRIVDRKGRRFKPDMIAVTANAACSIALRNAILKGVPKAFWSDIYDAARLVIVGDASTLANRRASALAYLQKFGATEEMVLATLGVDGVEDIGQDELVVLKGLATAIKEGDTTVEQAFAPKNGASESAPSLTSQVKRKGEAAPPTGDSDSSTPAEDDDAPPITAGEVIRMTEEAASEDALAEAESLIGSLPKKDRPGVTEAVANARARLGGES